jgi:branched-chain amino acid transport system permease protein
VALKELFQSDAVFGAFARHWQLLLGLTIIAAVALMPNGLVGAAAQLRARRRASATEIAHAG